MPFDLVGGLLVPPHPVAHVVHQAFPIGRPHLRVAHTCALPMEPFRNSGGKSWQRIIPTLNRVDETGVPLGLGHQRHAVRLAVQHAFW